MELNYKLGQTLIIVLEKECYTGKFHLINKSRTRIELVDVHDYHTHEQIHGVQKFYKSDIKSIVPLKQSTDEKVITDANSSEEQLPEESTTESDNCSILSEKDLNDINNAISDLMFFNQTDRSYHDAIRDIQRQRVVGLSIEGAFRGAHSRSAVVSICTTAMRIYMFDIVSLGKIPPDLRGILEAKIPLKIMHNSSVPSYILKLHQNIRLQSVFDTLIAHISLGNSNEAISVQKCLVQQLHLPLSFFPPTKNVNWSERPLNVENRRMAAKNVAYLETLYWHMLHEKMLKSFYNNCDRFLSIHRDNADDIQAGYDMCCNDKTGLQDVDKLILDMNLDPNIDGITHQ